MTSIRGPALFLSQFLRDKPSFRELDAIAPWVAKLGYKGIQVPAWDPRTINLDSAAEFRPSGRVGGYQAWSQRAEWFRSPGDGQVDFTQVFTLLAEAGYDRWAVLEKECCFKSPEQGAREDAPFITRHIIETSDVAFDDFAGSYTDEQRNRRILGFES